MNYEPKSDSPNCKICGNHEHNRMHNAREMMFGFRDEFRYLECGACRCLQLVDVPGDMSKYYPPHYYSFATSGKLKSSLNRQRAAYVHGARTFLGWLALQILGPDYAMAAVQRARIHPQARVLDVGCGAGHLIRDMHRLGYQSVLGIDPHIRTDIHHPEGVTVLKRTLQAMTGEFDFIMLHHSFEHMPDPVDALAEVRRLVAPGGCVLIRIPIADSFAWRRYGTNWIHLDAPRHLFLYTPSSMHLLADRCGLRVTELVCDGNPSQFIGSEQYEQDIALAEPRSVYSGGARRWVSWWRTRQLAKRAEELNQAGLGDWGCFALQPITPHSIHTASE